MTTDPPLSPADLARFVAGSDREVLTVGASRGLRVSRTYATEVGDLWACWTDPERTARWLGRPYGDLHEGGTVRLVLDGPTSVEPPPGATTGFARVEVLHCDAPHRLTVRWAWDDEAPSVVDLTLADVGEGRTRLTLEHLVLEEHAAVGYGAGWEDLLARLDAAVTGRDPSFADLEPSLAEHWGPAAGRPTTYPLPAVSATPARGPGSARLEAERWVAATPAAVWDCLSTAEGLRRWYVTDVDLDARVGGRFRCLFDRGTATGEVVVCRPGAELSVTWLWDHTDRPSLMTLHLDAQTRGGVDGTLVRWREDDASGNVRGYAAGLASHLVGLDRAARGLPPGGRRWHADLVIALSGLTGAYADPFAS